MNKNELRVELAKERGKTVEWYIAICKKIMKMIFVAMLFMLIFDFAYLLASVYYGTDFYGFIGTLTIVVLELIAFIYACVKKFNFPKLRNVIFVGIIELLPILSFLYFGIQLGFIYILALAILRLITVIPFFVISIYRINEEANKKLNTKTVKVNGQKVTKSYYLAKVPAKKVVALVVSFLLFATSLFVVGFIGAGTGVMKDFTRRIAYSQSEEEGTVKVSKVLDGLAPLEIPSEVSILSFKGYEKYFVTSIEEGAFDGIKYLETVKIANGIKNIENGAFSNSSIKRLEIDSTNLNFNNSLENTSICEVYFTQQSCQSDLSESNLYGVNKVIVNKDAINGFRQQYASIEYLFAPTTEENEIYVNFNNTVIDTLIAKKGEDGSVTVNDPFKGEHAYEKVENGRHYQFVWWNKTNNDSATKVEFPYTTSESLNLFAEWVPIYNIDYVMDEGTANGTLTDRFYYTGGDISIPSASKDGYTFMGWFDNEEFKGTSITTIGQDTSKDLTLYAKFLKNYNSIFFRPFLIC